MGNKASRLCGKWTRVQRMGKDEQAGSFTSPMPTQGGGNGNGASAPPDVAQPGTMPDEVGRQLSGQAGARADGAQGGGGSTEEACSSPQDIDTGLAPDKKSEEERPVAEEKTWDSMRQFGSQVAEKAGKAAERPVITDGETKKIRGSVMHHGPVSRNSNQRSSKGASTDMSAASSLRNTISSRASAARANGHSLRDVCSKQAAVGKPFPKRPMACKLSAKTWAKLEELFRLMDQDGSNAVTREEARQFFCGAFAKLSVDAMFNEVDVDGSGAITAEEFVQFWLQVRTSGYKEQDILDELGEMLDGGAWVDWKDDRDTTNGQVRFPKRPFMCRLSRKCWDRCEELFHKISGNDPGMAITREKAQHFFKGAFCNISADAMFNEIDQNHHGVIRPKDFMLFWTQVRTCGYKDKDILEEIDNLMDGSPWVDWKDGRRT